MRKCFAFIVFSGTIFADANHLALSVRYYYSDRDTVYSGPGEAIASIQFDSTAAQISAAAVAAVIAQVMTDLSVALDTNEVTLLNPFTY